MKTFAEYVRLMSESSTTYFSLEFSGANKETIMALVNQLNLGSSVKTSASGITWDENGFSKARLMSISQTCKQLGIKAILTVDEANAETGQPENIFHKQIS